MQDVIIEIGGKFYSSELPDDAILKEVNKAFSEIEQYQICNPVTFHPVVRIDESLVDPTTGEIFENVEELPI